MCGIAGLINPGQKALTRFRSLSVREPEDLSQGMLGLLKHRGPDEMGLLIYPHGFMGNTRLSIVDLEHGTQPICNETEDIWVVHNGEIYDVDRHISGLMARGHVFKTRSDTEILVPLYEEYGEECLGYLRGMFAFALWDKREDKLFAARDRFGIKPFLYCLAYQYNS